jgi:hypothetical protein
MTVYQNSADRVLRGDWVTSARWWLSVASCLVLSACQQPVDVTPPSDAPASSSSADRDHHDYDVEIVLDYSANRPNDFSEGLAFSKSGDLYVGFVFTGDIVKVSKKGRVSVFTRIDDTFNSFTLGLAFDRQGNLYVAVLGFEERLNGIWRVTPDGHASLYAAMPVGTIPNFIVFDERGWEEELMTRSTPLNLALTLSVLALSSCNETTTPTQPGTVGDQAPAAPSFALACQKIARHPTEASPPPRGTRQTAPKADSETNRLTTGVGL